MDGELFDVQEPALAQCTIEREISQGRVSTYMYMYMNTVYMYVYANSIGADIIPGWMPYVSRVHAHVHPWMVPHSCGDDYSLNRATMARLHMWMYICTVHTCRNSTRFSASLVNPVLSSNPHTVMYTHSYPPHP